MSNASNNVVLMGTVMTNVQFLTTKQGVEFAARFMLAVKKGYKTSNGYQATDLIPIRIKGENRMGFAKMLHKNDRICLSGSVASEKYETKDGQKVYSVLIDADQVEWANNRQTSNIKKEERQPNKQAEPSAENTIKIDLNFAELPFV